MFNTRLEVGTSMVGIMAITVEIREISTPTRRETSQVADKGATKDGRVLVVIDREHRIRSSMVVRAIMAIKDSPTISCNRSCVSIVERMATSQGFAASSVGMGKISTTRIESRTQRRVMGTVHSPRGRAMHRAHGLLKSQTSPQSKS